MYDHQKVTRFVEPSAQGNGEATGVEAAVKPGLFPLTLRRVGVVLQTEAATGTSAVVTIERRPIAETAANEVTLGTITVAAGALGQIFYSDQFNDKISPGEDVVADVTTAMGTQATFGFIFEFDPAWEHPSNIAAMNDGGA